MTENAASESAPEPAAKTPRRRELDFLRGLALVVMTVGHPLRVNLAETSVDVVRFHYNVYGELFSAMFMFMSAINVQNFVASAARTPDFDATRFYVRASVALYLMGSTYNMIVGTLVVIDIIQAIAVGTLFAYMLLRIRASAISLAIITAALLAAGLAIVGPQPLGEHTLERVGWLRYAVAMFGPIPWLGFFSYGLLIDRIPRGRAELVAIPLALALFVAGHFLPPLEGTKPAALLFKANPRYLVMALGLLPFLHLACRRWYRGGFPVARLLEWWGTESLVFLVFHWFFIFMLRPWQLAFEHRFNESVGAWASGIVTLFMMALTVRLIAERRDAWLKKPEFPKKAWRVFYAGLAGWMMCFLVALAAASRGIAPGAKAMRAVAVVFAFAAAFSFTILYPHVRMRLRERSMRPAAP
ncbi:acyltransferase [bacterium]|nr:acyltransferase [bacterium]